MAYTKNIINPAKRLAANIGSTVKKT